MDWLQYVTSQESNKIYTSMIKVNHPYQIENIYLWTKANIINKSACSVFHKDSALSFDMYAWNIFTIWVSDGLIWVRRPRDFGPNQAAKPNEGTISAFTDRQFILLFRSRRYEGFYHSQFNVKITYYQYRKSHYGDKTILQPSYLHNGISYTGKMTS